MAGSDDRWAAAGAVRRSLPAGSWRLDPEPGGGRRGHARWRWAGRWAPTASRAIARRLARRRSWSGRRRRTGDAVERMAHGAASWCATWSTRRPRTWGRRKLAARPRPTWRSGWRMTASVIVGDELLKQNYPDDPCGRPRQRARAAPDRSALGQCQRIRKVTLVGKGVCFDTGGLDLKNDCRHEADEEGHGRGGRMRWRSPTMIMAAKLKVRLRVLVPAVENSVSGNAFRPLDVLQVAQGHHGRDRQHRRGRAPDPGRCADRGVEREAGADRGLRDTHRGGARGAGAGAAGDVQQ